MHAQQTFPVYGKTMANDNIKNKKNNNNTAFVLSTGL